MTRRLTAAVCGIVILLAASLASAQVTTVATLPQQQRQGTYQTASYTVPADATGYVKIVMNINTADYENTANSLQFRIYWLDVDTWKLYVGGGWVGGRVDDWELGVNPMPAVETNIEPLRGKQVRGEIDIPNRMRVGCTVDVRPQ